jgi:hypothetical protein
MLKAREIVLIALLVSAAWDIVLVLQSDISAFYQVGCDTNNNQNNCPPHHLPYVILWYVGYVVNSATITAAATGVIAWFTATIWQVNRNQLSHAHRVERAYISCGGYGEFATHIITSPTGHPIPGRHFTGDFQVHVNNHGKTTVEIFRFAIEFRDENDIFPTEPVYTNFIPHHNWIGPGTQSRPLFPVALPANLRNPIIVYGRVWFRDIFSQTEHWSSFFQSFDRDTGASDSIPPPFRSYTDWDHDDP